MLDASFIMQWRDVAYVEMYVNQDKKRALKVLCIGLTFCHTRGIAIISEVTEKSNTIILCMYVLL